jgi:hypothetical protein
LANNFSDYSLFLHDAPPASTSNPKYSKPHRVPEPPLASPTPTPAAAGVADRRLATPRIELTPGWNLIFHLNPVTLGVLERFARTCLLEVTPASDIKLAPASTRPSAGPAHSAARRDTRPAGDVFALEAPAGGRRDGSHPYAGHVLAKALVAQATRLFTPQVARVCVHPPAPVVECVDSRVPCCVAWRGVWCAQAAGLQENFPFVIWLRYENISWC